MRRRRILTLIGSLLLAWLLLTLGLYYILHKPITPAIGIALGRVAADLILALALVTAAGGLGRRLAPSPHPEPLAALALQAALGLGVCAIGLLALGALGLLTALAGWLSLLALLAVLRREAWDWLRAWRALPEALSGAGALGALTAGLGAWILLSALAEALAPAVHFDALVYHLPLARGFVRAGDLAFAPDNPYWGMPFGAELLYAWALALGRAETAAVFGWLTGAVAVAGVLGLGRAIGRHAGWVAVAALLGGETLAASLGWAYADWWAALYATGLLAAIAGAAGQRRGGLRAAAVAGALAGMAIGAKYTAALAALGGLAAWSAATRGRRWWSEAGVFGLAALLTAAPWLIKNLALAGVPLYPFLGHTQWVDGFRQAFFRGPAATGPWLLALLAPWRAVIEGLEGAPGFAASLSPLLLGLLPGVLLIRRSRREALGPFFAYLAVGWAAWAIGAALSPQLVQARLYYVLYPAWAVLAGAGFEGLARLRLPTVRFGVLAGALVALTLSLTAAALGLQGLQRAPLAAALGILDPSEYRRQRLGGYALAMDRLAELGPSARVLMLWEPRGDPCLPTCRPDYWIDRWLIERRAPGDGLPTVQRWGEQGLTHVLVYRAGQRFIEQTEARYTEDDWEALERTLAGLTLIDHIGDGYELYQVPPP